MEDNFLEIKLQTVNDKVKFLSGSRDNPEITIDYFPPIGSGEGYTSLELLLMSFSSCISSTVLTILRAFMHKNIVDLKVRAKGIVREEHPKAFSEIRLEMVFKSGDVKEEDLNKALALAEEKLCPVWAMLKGNVAIHVSFVIEDAEDVLEK
jgi:Predicted redox protein, regulator of disulfide bond formation